MQCFIFLSDGSKQDAATTTSHSKSLIGLLKKLKKTDININYHMGKYLWLCRSIYIYASALYLMSVLSQCHYIIIDQGISAPGHGKEVAGGINSIDKRYMYQLISNVQIPGSKRLIHRF